MHNAFKLAIPSKGAMEEPCVRFLSDCGMPVRRASSRQYSAPLGGGVEVQAVFQRAADIPQKIVDGVVDAGITGLDIFREHGGESAEVVVAVEDLGFARCSLVLAVPEVWFDVSGFNDLADVAAEYRRRGRVLRVATKFPRLVRKFLLENGVTAFSLVESSGALEIAPSMGYADLIADIQETGNTLRANHLKPIQGGVVLESQACLLVNKACLLGTPDHLETLRNVLEMIEAHKRAAEVISVTANIEGDSEEAVARMVLSQRDIAGVRGPSIAPVYDPEMPGRVFAVTVIVPTEQLAQLRDHLRCAGGGAITVVRPQYVFEQRSRLFDAVCQRLGLSRLGAN